MAEPIPLSEARRRKQRKGGDNEPASVDFESCPVTVLGHLNGEMFFLDSVGQLRALKASQMSRRTDVVMLFGGSGVVWLEKMFPRKIVRKVTTPEGDEYTETVAGFQISAVSDWLMAQAVRAGLFGAHIRLRKRGVWPGERGLPVVHCGDAVIANGEVFPPGRMGVGDIFTAAPPLPRPAAAAGPDVARELQAQMKEWWNYKKTGSEIVLIGLIGLGYLGAAATWRSNGFLIGNPGTGKSKLLDMMRAMAPMHHYTNDTSKAGLEQSLNGNAMQIFVDEASDRVDERGARALMDIVLSATGGEGTKGHRGSAGGEVRSVNVLGSIVMSSVNPPTMLPQHESRFTMIETVKPDDGADHTAQHDAAIEMARGAGAALWGRALAGFGRFRDSLAVFREALRGAGCAPREMDQAGAILAGWWVLTNDGLPSARDGLEGVGAITEHVRLAKDIAETDSSRRMIDLLLSSLVAMNRSTETETIGMLINKAFSLDVAHQENARQVLARYGIRCVGENENTEQQPPYRPIPRAAEGAGIWFANSAEPLKNLFKGSVFEGDRWRYQLMRLETARASASVVRIGGLRPSRAVWVARYEIIGDGLDL